MIGFLSLIFLTSLFGIWYFGRKKTNKRLLSGTIAIAVISFLTIGGLNSSNKQVESQKAEQAQSAKKESLSKAKKESEALARSKSEAKASSLAKKEAEARAQEASESSARAESERIEQENNAHAQAEQAQQESIATAQATQTNNNNVAPVNNGDLNTADANAQGVIVGNANSRIYHVPGQRGYRMNSANAVYFNSEAEAQAAGYRKALR